MVRIVRYIVVGEAQRGEAGGGVDLVASPVAGLLGGSTVITQPVGLDDEAQLGPVEVDAKAVDDSRVRGIASPAPRAIGRALELEPR